MANLLFSFETGAIPLSRIVDAVCLNFNYQPLIDGETNPETKANFARRMIKEFIIDIVKSQEVSAAKKTAGDAITSINLT